MITVPRLIAFCACLALAASPVRAQAPEVPAIDPPAVPAPVVPPPSAPGSDGSTIVERVLVRVNGEIFTQSQLTQRQIDALRAMERDPSMTLEQQVEEITPDLLVEAVDELLLVQQGRELGITFSDQQFQTALENIKKSNGLDDAGLDRVLEQEGLTREQLRQRFEQQFIIQGVQRSEIGPSMTITLEEQRQYYKAHADQFMTPDQVTLRELLIAVPTRMENGKEVFAVADETAARTEIEALRARLVAGEDFDAIAKEHSDSATQASGGLVGPVNVADLSTDLQNLVNQLEPGEVSDPVRVARGFQIFKVEARSRPELRPFDEVRREIENAIRNERIGPETEKLLTRLRAQAVIEWKDETLKALYEARLAEGTDS
jgi:peptidyl-prolyl cis-trans isomerase SurA